MMSSLDAGALCRRTRQAPRDTDARRRRLDLDADAGVGAAGAELQLGVFVVIEKGRMLVQPRDQAAHRVLEQLVVVDAVDVVLAHALHDLGQQPGVLPGQRRRPGLSGRRHGGTPFRHHAATEGQQHAQQHTAQQYQQQAAFGFMPADITPPRRRGARLPVRPEAATYSGNCASTSSRAPAARSRIPGRSRRRAR
jgi:hypothetical protein